MNTTPITFKIIVMESGPTIPTSSARFQQEKRR